MAGPVAQVAANDAPGTKPATKIEERRSPELVIAFVGPVASGVTIASQIFNQHLTAEYGYKTFLYKVSDIIKKSSNFVNISIPINLSPEERIKIFQRIGNELRRKFGGNYLAKKCVDQIANNRLKNDGYRKEGEDLIPEPKRFAHIIDSLKHPEELVLLRMIYGDLMTLVGIFAPLEVRRQRLKNFGVAPSQIDSIITSDEHEDETHGQEVRDTFHNADLFIRNDKDNDKEISSNINRYLEIIFGSQIHTPNQDEISMHHAISAASKSACMSKQVGASIYSEKGEMIGVGWNDVPRFGGGLYSPEDGNNDKRCYAWGGKICHNDDRKDKLKDKILVELKSSGAIKGTASDVNKTEQALQRTDIRNLIEYSRAIHAEMDAILSAARKGTGSTVSATLYSSTFPCHNCARHIVAAGIKRVVYIEPYPKSLANELHNDAVSENPKDYGERVVFEQFDGIAPRNIIKYFKSGQERKIKGKLLQMNKVDCAPVFQPPIDSFTLYEQKIVKELHEVEDAVNN
jgi:deoxycytidylate deaminase